MCSPPTARPGFRRNDGPPDFFTTKEFAGQDFAKRSGLVDERALFTEEELRVLHAGLVKMSILDQDVSTRPVNLWNGFLTKSRTLSRSCGSRKWSLTLIWSSASRKKWRLEDSKMSSKRNQTIAIARFLMYKYGLNQQLEGMTDERIPGASHWLGCGAICSRPDEILPGAYRRSGHGTSGCSFAAPGYGLSHRHSVYAL